MGSPLFSLAGSIAAKPFTKYNFMNATLSKTLAMNEIVSEEKGQKGLEEYQKKASQR